MMHGRCILRGLLKASQIYCNLLQSLLKDFFILEKKPQDTETSFFIQFFLTLFQGFNMYFSHTFPLGVGATSGCARAAIGTSVRAA